MDTNEIIIAVGQHFNQLREAAIPVTVTASLEHVGGGRGDQFRIRYNEAGFNTTIVPILRGVHAQVLDERLRTAALNSTRFDAEFRQYHSNQYPHNKFEPGLYLAVDEDVWLAAQPAIELMLAQHNARTAAEFERYRQLVIQGVALAPSV